MAQWAVWRKSFLIASKQGDVTRFHGQDRRHCYAEERLLLVLVTTLPDGFRVFYR
jgi:hypothetical protein